MSLASEYANRMKTLYAEFVSLSKSPDRRVQAKAFEAVGALNELLERLRQAGIDLDKADPYVRSAYHSVAVPMLEGQLKYWEERLHQLKAKMRNTMGWTWPWDSAVQGTLGAVTGAEQDFSSAMELGMMAIAGFVAYKIFAPRRKTA